MNKIISQFNDNDFKKMGNEAISDFYKTMAIDTLNLPGLRLFATGVDSSSLNVVIDNRHDQEINEETIQKISGFFEKSNVPWSWFITDLKKSKEIEQQDFQLLYETPSMYFDLSAILPELDANNIDIRSADDELFEWIVPLQDGFPSTDNCEIYRRLNAKLQKSGEDKLQHFIVYCNNEPASAGTLFLSQNSVMIHNLATRNKYLRQGFGTALTLHMMSIAKKAGYKHCFLDSSDEGFNLYTRLGFKMYGITWVYIKRRYPHE